MAEDSREKKSFFTKINERFLHNHSSKLYFIALAMWIALAMFLHFREVRIDFLELDNQAKKYIVAQVDFEFPDEEGTVILRQEAMRDIGIVYQIDEDEIDKRRFEFENFLIHNEKWRKALPQTTFEEMYQEANDIKTALQKIRFADSRTIHKMENLQVPLKDYEEITSSYNGEQIPISDQFWEDLRDQLLKKRGLHPSSIVFATDFFRKFQWTLMQDISARRHLRKLVEESIPEKFTQVHAGSRILDQGEKVSQKHIAMLQAMKKTLSEKQNLWQPLTLLGSLLFAFIITFLGGLYFSRRQKGLLKSIRMLALFATIVIATLLLAKLTEYFLLRNSSNLMDVIRFPLIIPFAAILLTVLVGTEVALFTTFFLSVIIGLTLAVDHSRFLTVNLIAGIVAILTSQQIRKRKEVFVVFGKVWVICIPIFFVFNFAQNIFFDFTIASDLVSTFISLLLTAILVVGLLPILESIFHVMTDITLMEYMDPNNELLRRLSLEAPGTYQHCLVVGSLAEAAAQAIGANGLFCRVSTLYHDIGKLFNPHYFTENQMGGFNIHQLLTPLESTQVIIAHVAEGVNLARKHGLPQSFIDVIQEHHGTTLVYYFYCKQVEQMGGDVDSVEEKDFRYPGPTPRSRESAIIMIADTVEAASRSMEEISEKAVTELVNRLVSERMEEGQFNNCLLTFEELGVVKKTIAKTLSVTRHLRIKYPQKNINS